MDTKDAGARSASGWTALHSWIFLGIVAVGVIVIGVQNRYHYLNPFGLGKAYRIDRLFGGIQEYDPAKGWIPAQLIQPQPQAAAPPQAVPTLPLPGSMARAPMMNNFGRANSTPPPAPEPPAQTMGAVAAPPSREERVEQPPKPTAAPVESAAKPVAKPALAEPAPELSLDEKYEQFQKEFPEFGWDEFQLAQYDIYPGWRKQADQSAGWSDFLTEYREFIQWWKDSGSPQESGVKLWETYSAEKKD